MPMTPPPGFKVPPPRTPTKHFGPKVTHRSDVIAALATSRGWTAGAELGTAEGKTAERVLVMCPNLTLIAVDAWAVQPDGEIETYADWPQEQHERDARARLGRFGKRAIIMKSTTVEAARHVADASLDFVFVDADHSEQGVRIDIKTWRPKIRPGGILLGHDAAWESVRAAIDDLCPGYWVGPNDVWGIDV